MIPVICDLAERLTAIWQERRAGDDSAAWQAATCFTEHEPEARKALKEAGISLDAPQAVRRVQGYDGPGASWLANAAKTRRVFEELFIVDNKPVRFEVPRLIANSRVPDKPAVLAWVIETRPTDRELRDRIRVEVDGISPVIKPMDLWTFNPPRYGRIDTEAGHGYIPGDLYVNILWYWAEPGDVVADVMAGSGMLLHIWERREEWYPKTAPPLGITLELFDLTPRGPYGDLIRQHDARDPLPIRPNLAIADVPYFKIVAGQYSERPEDIANAKTLEEWAEGIGCVARALAATQEHGDRTAIVVPNYHDFKSGRVMAAEQVRQAFYQAGYGLEDVAYSGRGMQRTTAGKQMIQVNRKAKESKVMLAEVAEILLFSRRGKS